MAQKTIRPLEPTAALRRILIAALDATSGDPTTGVTPANTDLKILKTGAASPAEATATGALTALVGGYYYYEFAQAEIDTRGLVNVRMTKAGLKAVSFTAEVDAQNLYSFGKLQAASGTSMTLAAGESSVSTDYVGLKISINGRERYIVGYDGSTKIALVDSPFPTTPATNDVYYIFGSTGFQAITAASVAQTVWASTQATNVQPGSFGAALQAIRGGQTAQAGAASSITLDASASIVDNYPSYLNHSIIIVAGTGVGQQRTITGYVGSTKVATVDTAWNVQPDNTSVYTILASSGVTGGGGGGLSAAQVSAAVWDEPRTSHVVPGSFGQGVASVQGAVTGAVGSVTGGVGGGIGGSVTGNVGGNVLGGVAGSVGSVTAPVTVAVLNDKTGMSLSSAGVDAILDDPITEPTAIFSWGTATIRQVIAHLGALSHNKIVQTASLQTLRNSADNATISTAVQSDDGTTYTRNQWT